MTIINVKHNLELHKEAKELSERYKEIGKDVPVHSIMTESWSVQAERLTTELVNMANVTALLKDGLVEGILKGILGQHRAIQADFIEALQIVLKRYGECQYDARNEHAVKAASRMADAYLN